LIAVIPIFIWGDSPWTGIQPALLQNLSLLQEFNDNGKKQGILIFMGSSMHAP